MHPTPVDPAAAHPATAPKVSFWRKLGGGSLTLSIIVHAVLLIIGVFWIFQIIPEKQPAVDFMPKGGGGGQPAAAEKSMTKRATMTAMNAPRLAAKGAVGRLTLPEPEPSAAITSVGALSSGKMSAGLGGNGSGGGKGDGKGTGFGNGMGPGMGGGGGSMNPFGMLNPNSNALVGDFYDFKQTKDRKPTGYGEPEFLVALKDFTTRGWNQRTLDKYYKAPKTLYQTKIYMPMMSAQGAPDAFGCGKEVEPIYWVAIYRGNISPPKSGKYRFVGRADNVMVIRFNGQTVLDGGDYSANLGRIIWDQGSIAALAGRSSDHKLEGELRRAGYDIPVKSYNYSNCQQYNERGGLMVGKEINVTAGSSYPVEILISELGGNFGASLLIEEVGATYQNDSTGSPIFPLFRLDQNLPKVTIEPLGSPPFDPNGPVWKVVGGHGSRDI